MQVKRATKGLPPLTFHQEKGLYESDVKLYFHGDFEMYLIRESFQIFDNNNFATAWITTALMEAYRLGDSPKPSEEQIFMSVEAMSQYYNKNVNYTNSIQNFWPQAYNSSLRAWQSTPQNLLDLFDLSYGVPWDTFFRILEDLGQQELVKTLKSLLADRDLFRNAFMIPPDFDDTFVNLGIGSLLQEVSSDFPQSSKLWKEKNSNLTSVFDALKKYAYRPMSNDSKVNSIDPRTYMYLHPFLEEAMTRNEDIALVPTWVQDTDEVRTGFYSGVDMPFNINNVDVTVAANTIYGITNAVLTGLVNSSLLDDPEIQQVYLNTSNMIAFEIKTNFTNRKDLALTYYPSEFEFYWFVARTYHQLQYYERIMPLHPVQERIRISLGAALCGRMTDHLLDSYMAETDGSIYYDDFLGDGDFNSKNVSEIRAEDRIFTTAMAVNALLTTWTVYNDVTKKLEWTSDTHYRVIDTVTRAVHWLNKNVLNPTYRPWNAFFSGSVKGSHTLPFEYPFNRLEFLNGTKIPDHDHFPRGATIIGMQGVQSPAWYKAEIKKTHFGYKVPTEFKGYNTDNAGFFPFWSSVPYTYVSTLLALSKFNNVEQKPVFE
ncbi:hypothetical protein FSP39_018295 [Pinctada imbricata]|uniref:Uncharacterized protein n=1 Tax=Pinctada imbricata TaxID=66713 RepID=A0AA88Y573_PINIB|nr:hypothetical protein FSP39_018295 [Pinctada imbricata]